MIGTRCARDINLGFTGVKEEEFDSVKARAQEISAAYGVQTEDVLEYRAWNMGAIRQGDGFEFRNETSQGTIYAYITVFDLDDYNAFAGTNYTLDSGRVLLSDPDGTFDSETIGLFGKTYQVEEIEMPHVNSEYAAYIGIEKYGLVISDPELIVDGRIQPRRGNLLRQALGGPGIHLRL